MINKVEEVKFKHFNSFNVFNKLHSLYYFNKYNYKTMKLNEKIFIAGHNGLVGSAIVRKLKADGYNNIVTRSHKELDLTRQADVEEFFSRENPDYVILAAAMVGGIHANNTYPGDFIYSNLCIQNNVIHAAYLNNVKKLLFLGSSCIYPKECPQPMKEEHLLSGYLEPTNEPYAIAKISGIKMCQAYNRQYKTNYISVMPTNLYGPNDNFDLMNSHVLPAMIRKFHLAKLALEGDFEGIKRDEKKIGTIPGDIKESLGLVECSASKANKCKSVVLWGTGSPRREFLHVDDLADACVFLMNNYDDSAIVNIGTGHDSTIKEIAELIRDIVGIDIDITFDSTKPDGTMLKKLDVSKLNSLGWKASVSLKEGIKNAYRWYIERQR